MFSRQSLIFMDAIGDWNPQLLRELKSRLQWRKVLMVLALSIAIQGMLIGFQIQRLPTTSISIMNSLTYCQTAYEYSCVLDAQKQPIIMWAKWWEDLAVYSSIVMFVSMIVLGVYFIASSFYQEDRRGTLDFLRLTPQNARSIILGKILGIPILLYLAVICVFPLQFYAVQHAHLSRLNVLTWDLAMLALSLLFYLGAILMTLWCKAIPIFVTILSLGLSVVMVRASLRWRGEFDENTLQWYGIQLGNHPFSFLLLTAMAGLGIYWLAKAIARRYHQPNASSLSRVQSYFWSLSYHLFLLGFCMIYKYLPGQHKLASHLSFDSSFHDAGYGGSDVFPQVFLILAVIWLMLLIPLLLPSKQSLLSWVRQVKQPWPQMLWDDRSPAILAMIANLGIGLMVWIVPVVIDNSDNSLSSMWLGIYLVVLGLIISVILMGIYSTVAHLGLFWQMRNARWWNLGVVTSLILLPILGGIVCEIMRFPFGTGIYLFSLFCWKSIEIQVGLPALGAMIVLLMIWGWLTLCLRSKLSAVGRSELAQHLD
jgi:hypothetical protein